MTKDGEGDISKLFSTIMIDFKRLLTRGTASAVSNENGIPNRNWECEKIVSPPMPKYLPLDKSISLESEDCCASAVFK